MKVFIISVVMWWADPALMPNTDAVEVHTLHGKPLFFKTRADCFEHIDQNLEAPTMMDLISSPDIYFPLIVFTCLVLITIYLRKFFYKD